MESIYGTSTEVNLFKQSVQRYFVRHLRPVPVCTSMYLDSVHTPRANQYDGVRLNRN